MAQAVIGARSRLGAPSADTGQGMPKKWLVYGLPLAVAVVALCQAALLYQGFLQSPRQLWIDPIHDRNAHYWLGLNFGLDLRHADLPHFIHDLHSARAWPPLHALLVGLCLTVGGIDYRLAVLPSLVGWIGTAVFAFLATRRAVSRGGSAAGLIAALFVLVSPAHRAFATDIMLESLGACLTVAALYAYLAAVQDRTAWAGRCLGLALTALFFEKYNYWLLVVFGLVASEILARRQPLWRAIPGALTACPWRAWLRAQLRHPLTYPLVVLLALLAGVVTTGGGSVHVGRHAISLHSPNNLVTVAYALLVLRLVPWWWRVGRGLVQGLDPVPRALVYWHVAPVLLWWLWPQRLSYCLWYVSPANSGEVPHHDLLGGVPYYMDCLAHDYHLGSWSLLIAIALAGVGLLAWGRLRVGGSALLCFLLIAAVLTCVHPNRKSRFLHSWIGVGWVVAGIGVAQILGRRRLLTATAVGGLALAHGPGLWQPGRAPEGGPRPDCVSMLGVTDCYLDALAGSRRVAILSNMPVKFWTGWTFLGRYGRPAAFETDLKGVSALASDSREAFRAWLRTTACDHLLFMHIGPTGPFFQEVPYADYDVVPDVMKEQGTFGASRHWDLPQYGCSVTLWSRPLPSGPPPSSSGTPQQKATGPSTRTTPERPPGR